MGELSLYWWCKDSSCWLRTGWFDEVVQFELNADSDSLHWAGVCFAMLIVRSGSAWWQDYRQHFRDSEQHNNTLNSIKLFDVYVLARMVVFKIFYITVRLQSKHLNAGSKTWFNFFSYFIYFPLLTKWTQGIMNNFYLHASIPVNSNIHLKCIFTKSSLNNYIFFPPFYLTYPHNLYSKIEPISSPTPCNVLLLFPFKKWLYLDIPHNTEEKDDRKLQSHWLQLHSHIKSIAILIMLVNLISETMLNIANIQYIYKSQHAKVKSSSYTYQII